MKNVKFVVKFRRLAKSLAVSIFLLMLFAGSSGFTSFGNDGDPKKSAADSVIFQKVGFKSLFTQENFDPTKPYITQLNPRAVPFVQEYIKLEGARLEKMKIWGKPYFDMYDGILAEKGLPKELKYLSVIESDLTKNAVSPMGAAGPWQIMDFEARRVGLIVNSRTDERTNFHKSTYAAARILKELYNQFEDWTLVIAAYNCGAGRLRQAIRKSGSRDFWTLQYHLPLETRNHVKRFIGTHYIMEGTGGLTTMSASEMKDYNAHLVSAKNTLAKEDDKQHAIVPVNGRFNSKILAKKIGLAPDDFNVLNPNFDRLLAIGNTYNMRLPFEKVELFKSSKNEILSESLQALLSF